MGWIKRKEEGSTGTDEAAPPEEEARATPADPVQADEGEAQAGAAPLDSDRKGGAQPSIISSGMEISGELRSNGPIHVEGRIEGSLESDEVLIGATGEVTGEVQASQLSVHGAFEGDGVCERLTIGPSASYRGSLDCESLELATGGILVGKVQVGST